MATYNINYDPETRTVHVQHEDVAEAPEDTVAIGTFDYVPGDINTFYHHVRDALYRRKPDGATGFWPENETDMQRITILGEVVDEPVAVTGVTLVPAAVSVEEGATTQLTATVAPANATNAAVTYESSAAGTATVSNTGLVTGVAAGEATITVTTTDGGFTDTTVVTVTAA